MLAVSVFSLIFVGTAVAQPGYSRPDYDQQRYNQPDYNQYDYGQPGYDEPYDGDFYDDLAPHGQWVQTPEYGRVWIPNVGPDFQPYASNGHWVVTEYGNTWVSDYTWGWAPFHYGRWYQDRYRGWAWIPGRDWGPAWVSWRSGGGYYGWAPLGPGININVNVNIPPNYWVFVPQIYITSPRLYNYCVPRRQVVNVYQNTTIINNIYRVNNRAYAYGPRRDEIERVTRRSVPVYRVENSGRPGRDEIRNNSVGIYRPDMNRNGRGTTYGSRNTNGRGNGNSGYGSNRYDNNGYDNSRSPNSRGTYQRPDVQPNTDTYEGGPRNNGNTNGRRNRYEPPTQQSQPSASPGRSYPQPQQPTERIESVPQPDRGNRRGNGGYSQRESSSPTGNQPGYSQPGNGQSREQRSEGNEQREQRQPQPQVQTQTPQGGNPGGGRGPRGPR